MKKLFTCSWIVFCLFSSNAWSATVELQPIVVTASRMAQHDYKIAGNVTVITKEEIESSTAQSIPE
ncbi:MAG: hypothetical protein HZA29_04845, partial [Candidatus Omnitrophica bacterium]|nr:hypothetical protein [Candidatus Omnitrophota bacterium]